MLLKICPITLSMGKPLFVEETFPEGETHETDDHHTGFC